ncbi:MAG: hypothetical protein ACLQVD_21485 [Capsulimonadaceae bacterium]
MDIRLVRLRIVCLMLVTVAVLSLPIGARQFDHAPWGLRRLSERQAQAEQIAQCPVRERPPFAGYKLAAVVWDILTAPQFGLPAEPTGSNGLHFPAGQSQVSSWPLKFGLGRAGTMCSTALGLPSAVLRFAINTIEFRLPRLLHTHALSQRYCASTSLRRAPPFAS